MPLLNDDGDKYNADLITRICIRYAQVPRTITKDEFVNLRTNYMLLDHSQYKKYITMVPEMFAGIRAETKDGKAVKRYTNWQSFKDWCVEKQVVKEYIQQDE